MCCLKTNVCFNNFINCVILDYSSGLFCTKFAGYSVDKFFLYGRRDGELSICATASGVNER